MKPIVECPIRIRGLELGGAQPLFCVPLVGGDIAELTEQAEIARRLNSELVEWRADFFKHRTPEALAHAARLLRQAAGEQAIIFTLRARSEGGAADIPQADRCRLIEAVLRAGAVDLVDLELASDPEFLDPLMALAREQGVRVILAFHDFERTPSSDALLNKVEAMRARGADMAKLAVMPRTPEDVLRLLQVTAAARDRFRSLPLATMSMGPLGSITRVAGFLYGSDMAFAVAKEASAPGQMPLEDARRITAMLLQYS
jgi:3-dehydroquinate dehydratase I